MQLIENRTAELLAKTNYYGGAIKVFLGKIKLKIPERGIYHCMKKSTKFLPFKNYCRIFFISYLLSVSNLFYNKIKIYRKSDLTSELLR